MVGEQIYKMAGNAASVLVISVIGEEIQEICNEYRMMKGGESNGNQAKN